MILIGVCGGVAAGKSVLLEVMEERGFLCLDCDKIIRALMSDCDTPRGAELREAVCERFGPVYRGRTLDSGALGERLREDIPARRALFALTTDFLCREIEDRLEAFEKAGGAFAATDAVQSCRGAFRRETTCNVLVEAPWFARVLRAAVRERISVQEAARRVSLIGPAEDVESRYTLRNDEEREAFRNQCKAFLRERERLGW